jgi:Zn-dependent peptidase ImmA (M78 family)
MTPEQRAERVLTEAALTSLPIDVYRVARHLRVRIEKADLGDDVSGVLVRNEDTAVVGVHYSHHPNRQRFTIAHELGHFLLHDGGTYIDRGTYVRFRDSASGSGSDKEERDANQFAAALLMPRDVVARELSQQPFDLADDAALMTVARKFGVSIQALSFRLVNLGLLPAQDAVSRASRKRSR